MSHAVDDTPGRPDAGGLPQTASDRLIGITDIRELFKLGRTAAYELTHRPEFPDPIEISPHCYRWWASEVDKFAATLRRARAQGRQRRTHDPQLPDPAMPARRITGRARALRSRREIS